MNSRILHALACASALAAIAVGGSVAFAGQRTSVPVFISSSTGAGYAYGALGTARNSLDLLQDIGCTTIYAGNNIPPIVGCSAINSSGVSRSCVFALGSELVDGVQSLNDDTLLYFAWDAQGFCTELQTTNSSAYEPKL